MRWAVGLAGALFLTASCASDDSPTPSTDATADAEALGHVHGLGVDPGDGTLYAATHFGVFRVGDGGDLTRIADRWQDTMAFTVVGPGHFLGSGHPDLREDLPSHLGLIESLDAAESWSILSLGGEADFHALDVSGDRTYGYDATSGRIMTTTDRTNWTTVASGAVVDLAADPTNPDRILASAPDGTLTFHLLGSSEATLLDDAPRVVLVEWPTAELLVGVTANGQVHRSTNAGASWTPAADLPGSPEAFDATEREWHAATDRGIYRSEDAGSTWTLVVESTH
jgi:hypothetical protein